MAHTSPGTSPELKPEQAVAAHTLDRHLSVTAGPGAGKTRVLVQRYLEILRTENASVDNIVAITFTNRAANEMRERVRGAIDDLLGRAAPDERERWLRHKRTLEGAVITTIHGFCSRLLHEFPVEANIDPQFVLLDEQQATMMLEAVVDDALSNAIHHGNEKIVKLAQGVGGRGVLSGVLAELYKNYRGEGLTISEIRRRAAINHLTPDDYGAAFRELDARMSELLSDRVKTPTAREEQSKFAGEWPRVRAIVSQPPSEQTTATYCQAIEDFRDVRPRKNVIKKIATIDRLLWGEDSTADDRFAGKVPRVAFDLLAKDYALAVLNLIQEIESRLTEEKQKLSVVDFDDLQLRTLRLLNEHPQLMTRISERYRFFLVDEFQDTNGLQRDLMLKLGLRTGANLFIVGDRKQSIYGFRGADVDVFREMTDAIKAAGGIQQPLHLNFRSQRPLIDCLNFVFAKTFQPSRQVGIPPEQLPELGYVEHEASVAEREARDAPPLVEFLFSILPDRQSADSEDEVQSRYESRDARERDAVQLVSRIQELAGGTHASRVLGKEKAGTPETRVPFNYGNIAVLFRALTGVGIYESALRRAGIPYLTVQGKGFYQREEITDLIQLLRFLDNTTDEIALAAVLRSPVGGISDNALFALRSAPLVGETTDGKKLPRRNLWRAVRQHRDIQFIDEEEHAELDRVATFLGDMIERRSRYSIADLLRHAVAATDFMAVIAANFDGAHRIANVEKLFRLAEAFEKSGELIRDFVHYVEKFEEIGGRETEGQIDKTANVVRLMTIHQAKGLEFPVVILPDLQRYASSQRDNSLFVLDRHRGFSVAVPDGRGGVVRGATFKELRQRAGWREEFESMRLLYVAATRAEDRLIFSGAAAEKELKNLRQTKSERWLAWLWQALELDEHPQTGVLEFGNDVQIDLRVSREPAESPSVLPANSTVSSTIDPSQPLAEIFPLLRPVEAERGTTLRRFTITQLINFQRCPRQYYFERLLRTPGAEELAVWNDAEAPEPPANLTATLKGAVIHRFCETFCEGDNAEVRLRESFEHVRSMRRAQLAGRELGIDDATAVADLLPLAQNYLASDVFRRVEAAARMQLSENPKSEIRIPRSSPGLWSELRFRLRRPLGILTGTIDKLLITPAADGWDVEIIDFKTNRFSLAFKERVKTTGAAAAASPSPHAERGLGGEVAASLNPTPNPSPQAGRGGSARTAHLDGRIAHPGQAAFDFEAVSEPVAVEVNDAQPASSFEEQIDNAARDYRLQMQGYALALRELLPEDARINSLRATLHFIHPNVEAIVTNDLLEYETCARAIDDAMSEIASLDGTLEMEHFPPIANSHCRICNFLSFCSAGREWLRGR
ncbi:MAG TPA: UvrD-helicase domain-containing protein [Pyrinomonadaceae bacterium]|nr:UvrD-helicase domain-containing protein [Pyrinomonadaceae bacterium]